MLLVPEVRNVPYFDYPKVYLNEKDTLLKIIDDVSSRGAFILQKELTEFESNLAVYTGANYSIGVANATDGLEIAWMALGLRPGDEVICSSHTMLATASSIKIAGGTPVPVEIGSDNLIDPEAVEAAITPRTVGIMPTQLNGRTCDMDRLMTIANKYKLFVVEDAAQALGSRFKGRHAGTFGNASSISFFPAKVLGCLGDGGAVLTNDQSTYDKMYQLHDHGRDTNGDIKSWGRNSRLDNVQAAILDFRLKTYSQVIARRRHVAALYQELLGDMNELQLPPSPDSDPNHFDIYQNYELTADRRNELRDYLKAKGIGTLIQWGGKGVHQWGGLGFDDVKLPKVERFFERCIMLPMNMFISDADVQYIAHSIRNFYAQ
ncbi:DegT/DnrJ/EryC1/StrS family aminotransferase [bacterium]|nr:DegT/DnrJ/EryC1/StrS family aminotransferase [bacterium]